MRPFVVITGISQIDRRLKSLPGKVQKKVLRQAMRKGLKVIAAEVKTDAPVETGLTKSAVQVRVARQRRRDSISLEVRISGKKEGLIVKPKSGQPVFYPAIVEYKHNPFMRRAFDSKGETARQITIEAIRRGVEDEVRKS